MASDTEPTDMEVTNTAAAAETTEEPAAEEGVTDMDLFGDMSDSDDDTTTTTTTTTNNNNNNNNNNNDDDNAGGDDNTNNDAANAEEETEGQGAAGNETALFGSISSEDEEEVDRTVYVETGPPVEVPLGPAPKLGDKVFSVKLPDFLGVETTGYTRETYEDPMVLAMQNVEGQTIVIPPEFYLRWRETAGGGRESNTRLVEWEDGSYTLFIGDEPFDVQVAKEFMHRELAVQQPDSLETLGTTIDSRLKLKPVSTESRAHAIMTQALASQSLAKGRSSIKHTVRTRDDEADLESSMQRLRERERLRNAQLRKAAANAGRVKYQRAVSDILESDVLSGDDEFEDAVAGDLSAWSKQRKRSRPDDADPAADSDNLDDDNLFGTDSEDESDDLAAAAAGALDDEQTAAQRLRAAKDASAPSLPPAKRRKTLGDSSDDDE